MCSLERHGRVFLLRLVTEGEHRFTPSLCTELIDTIKTVESCTEARALVTTNEGTYYSNGLDLEWMKQEPFTRFPLLLSKLEQGIHTLMHLSIPSVASRCGHAAAGGMLFAMAHDYRFMRRDRGFLYSTAVNINVILPQGILSMMRSKMSPHVYSDAVLKCIKFTIDQGNAVGIVDKVFDDSQSTLAGALEEAQCLADKPWSRPAYRALCFAMYEDVMKKLEEDFEKGLSVDDIILVFEDSGSILEVVDLVLLMIEMKGHKRERVRLMANIKARWGKGAKAMSEQWIRNDWE